MEIFFVGWLLLEVKNMLAKVGLMRRGGTSITIRTAFGPVLLSALMICAAFALSSRELERIAQGTPLGVPTQPHFGLFSDPTVTLTCDNGKIIENPGKDETTICSNEKTSMNFGTGSYQLGAGGDSGYTFSGWSTTGDVSMSGDTLTVSGAGGLTAAFSACTSPTIGTPASQVRNGFQQAWVNWSYTNGVPSFSWSANGASLSSPAISEGSGSASINLNDLTAATTYDYTASVEGNCGTNVQESGSFSTASSTIVVDGSSATFENDTTTVSTKLTTSLSHDLIIAQVVSSTNPGYVTKCTDAESLSWSQRTNYTPASASPWEFIWSAEASTPLSSDSITCTYSTTGNFGLIVFGVANAYLASSFDNGSGIPCKAQGVPTVSCSVTTTDANDMLLGLVASYHTSGSPAITPGSGFTQINQEDVGPYGMAEFSGIESTPGTYAISATDSGVSGMAIVGDAVRAADYIGWTYELQSPTSPYLLLQDGPIVAGAEVNVTATCQRFGSSGNPTTPGSINFPAGTSGPSGYYQVGFPLLTAAGIPNSGGDIETFSLSLAGLCTTGFYGSQLTESNSKWIVTAGGFPGDWTDLNYVSVGFGTTSDFVPYVIDPNGEGYTAAALSLVHTTAADCETAFTVTSTQTVNALIGGSGSSQTTSATSTYGGQYPGWGNDSGVSLGWIVGGIMNDTALEANSAWPVSYESTAAVPLTTTDWLDDASFNYGHPTNTSYLVYEIPPTYQQSNPYPLAVSQNTTYASTSGTELSVDMGVNVGALSLGVSVPLTYTTTDVYTTQPTLKCLFYDPSTTQTAIFYYTFNGGTYTEAAVIHVWLAGYCPEGEETC